MVRVRVFQLEVQLEECVKQADAAGLVSVLHHEGLSSTSLSRLGQLVTQVRGRGGGPVAVVSHDPFPCRTCEKRPCAGF